MTILQAIVLGIVQGLTEFLPISSTGHLVLVPWLLGWKFDPRPAFIFDVLVQWGTLVAIIAYFWTDVVSLLRAAIQGLIHRRPFKEPHSRLAWLIIIASFPAALAGLLLKPFVEKAITNPLAVCGFLLFNAILLFVSDLISKRSRSMDEIRIGDSLWIGFFQVLALFPGISRSGSTIAGGLVRNLNRRDAARFSFLMAIPIMIGAGLIALIDLINTVGNLSQLLPLLTGFLAAAVVGYFAIRWFLRYLTKRSLALFAAYCAIIGLAGILYGALYG
jgi:undecaprenyl-diphosphatase